MSPSSLRALAAVAAAVFALLTGIATGMVAGRSATVSECRPVAGSSASPAPTSSSTAGNVVGSVERGVQGAPDLVCTKRPAGGFLPSPALVAAVGAALTGLTAAVLMVLAARRRREPVPARPVSAPPVSAPPAPPRPAAAVDRTGEIRSGDGRSEQIAADRAALVRACIYVRDRMTSKALADRLGAALADAGVTTVAPTGVPFDPGKHEAGGAVAAEEPAQAGTIAAVEVPGYTDRGGRVLRAPVVTVYQPAAAPPARHRTKEDR